MIFKKIVFLVVICTKPEKSLHLLIVSKGLGHCWNHHQCSIISRSAGFFFRKLNPNLFYFFWEGVILLKLLQADSCTVHRYSQLLKLFCLHLVTKKEHCSGDFWNTCNLIHRGIGTNFELKLWGTNFAGGHNYCGTI